MKIKKVNYPAIFFFCVIFFQLTVLKYIWSYELLSTLVNLLFLVSVNCLLLANIFKMKTNKNVWFLIVLPGLMVYLGMTINISYNTVLDISNLSYFGLVAPWALLACIPIFMKRDWYFDIFLWQLFYRFFVFSVFLGLIEYALVFFLPGIIPLTYVETSGGIYLSGLISIFWPLDNGAPHQRLYSVFLEPGTLGMFLLPVITYAYLYKKYFALILFITALVLTISLGAYVSFFLLPLCVFIYTKKKFLSSSTFIALILIMIGGIAFQAAKDAYESKQNSRTVRAENFEKGISEFPEMLQSNPLGMLLGDNDLDRDKSKGAAFTTFMPIYKFVLGGVLAFIGYLFIVAVSNVVALFGARKKELVIEEKVVFYTIAPLSLFLIQRTTLWESALFALLYAPSIIRFLSNVRSDQTINEPNKILSQI